MADQFVAEIRMFAGNFAPKGWALCNGQLLPISQNTALFSLLGTTYGGDGKSNFALPNLQGLAPMHWGQSTTGTLYDLGEMAGTETVTLLQSEMPIHSHQVAARSTPATLTSPSNNQFSIVNEGGRAGVNAYAASANSSSGPMTDYPGGGQPHENRQPYLILTFIIALQGIFPARN